MSNQTSSTILPFIKNLKKGEIKFTIHSKIKITQREFEEEEIIKILLNKIPVGIIFQENNKFKIMFEYSIDKDICIIVSPELDSVEILTLFLTDKKTRIRA